MILGTRIAGRENAASFGFFVPFQFLLLFLPPVLPFHFCVSHGFCFPPFSVASVASAFSFVHQTFSGCQCPGHTCQYSEPRFAPVSQIGLLAPVFTELLPAPFTSISPPLSLSPGLSWESADLVT